ncbi:MAG: hypothetical protein EP343_23670 [Deltaproteobacteria bacterium]|nr:MAG: hypothetical protein EP343_23670 [Deltaproteobacteria bacterium]
MIAIWLGLQLFATPMAQAKTTKPCSDMAKKICNTLGFDAFFCQVYVKVARHDKADQKRCHNFLNNNWELRLAALQRQEKILDKMKNLAKGNAGRKAQIKTYQESLAQKTINTMLTTSAGKSATEPINPKACKVLAVVACRGLGKKAFYCSVFRFIANKASKINPARCQLVLKNWFSSQGQHYKKREKLLITLMSKAKTDLQKAEVKRIKQNQLNQLVRFMRQK